jgi:serine/threonine protein kinase
VVDEVRNLATGAIFARKTINCPNEEESTSFLTEIEIMKKLAHPHIVQFIDNYTLAKSVSILMIPVANIDLGCYMSKHQSLEPIPMHSVIQWFGCLVSSVEYLHGKSIKHQDIKPSNILIKGRTILLSDFGISKVFEGTDSTTSTSGDVTWKYSSPETAQSGLRGRKADIFSLGCVFLEMFSFLIYQGHRDFNHFKKHHFSGNRTYQENLPMVKVWIESLRRDPDVEQNQLLRQLLDSWAPMLEQSSKNRPSAGDLSATLPPGKCCLPATDNVLNSQSAVNETQTVLLVGNQPITLHNPPHSSPLDDQNPTAKKLASQAGPVSNTSSQSSRYKMPDRPRTLKLYGKAMTNRTSWSRCFALFSIFITFMTILLIPSSDPATFEPQIPISSILTQTHHHPLPESFIAAGDLVIGTYFSTQVREVDWLIAGDLEEANARSDTLLGVPTYLDGYDGPM